MSKKIKKIPESIFGRASKLVSTGASLFGQEIALRAERAVKGSDPLKTLKARMKQTEGLVASLSQLKGAAMKAGQLLSIEASDILPPEITEILQQLHEESAFMPFEDVEKILLKELGSEKFAHFAEFSREPVAAASIGQVHKAYLDGAEVAIKVQFPGIANSIDSDLGLLRKIVKGFLVAGNRSIPIDALFEEIAANLKREVDYVLEADAVEHYSECLQEKTTYVVPKVFRDYSTAKVLTLSYEHGIRIPDWIKMKPSVEEVDRFARLILDLIAIEFFEEGLVQTDPNYGNFLYRPDTGQLVVLDFGAVIRYSPEFRCAYRKMGELAFKGRDTEILQHAQTMNLIDPRETKEAQDQLLYILELVIRMFLPENQPFQFGRKEFLMELREAVFAFISTVRYTPPPRDLVFLNRKFGGMFHLLKDINAHMDLEAYWKRIMALKIDA